MEIRGIISSSNKLKRTSKYKVTIADHSKDHMVHINTAIMNAHDAGLSRAEYQLPLNFPRIDNNITNEEIQTSIYFNIVTELERLGYEVKLKFLKRHTLLIILWVVKAEASDLSDMKRKLLSLQD